MTHIPKHVRRKGFLKLKARLDEHKAVADKMQVRLTYRGGLRKLSTYEALEEEYQEMARLCAEIQEKLA